ncbi:hypothetical protein DdX_13527 [Ditylenchus destructor]|uniref:Uncharacterized protein n=1 Tax=Ditylenchus destructor TaxID=166010 RepID=A0AAD4MWB5_9BILA|nr:hypothetical protein DdX_13527 [Ditylenchus destructor]
MTSIKNRYWLLIFAAFLGCCQLIPIPRKGTENLQSDPAVAKDPTLVELPTEKRSPQMSQSGSELYDGTASGSILQHTARQRRQMSSPFIHQTIKDQASDQQPSASSPHILTQKRDSKDRQKKDAENQKDREENAAENNSKSTKKSAKTPPQDKAPNDTSEEKREPQFLVASALSPHFLSLSGHDTLSKK